MSPLVRVNLFEREQMPRGIGSILLEEHLRASLMSATGQEEVDRSSELDPIPAFLLRLWSL